VVLEGFADAIVRENVLHHFLQQRAPLVERLLPADDEGILHFAAGGFVGLGEIFRYQGEQRVLPHQVQAGDTDIASQRSILDQKSTAHAPGVISNGRCRLPENRRLNRLQAISEVEHGSDKRAQNFLRFAGLLHDQAVLGSVDG
jgi:hypothetical protein